MCSTCPPPQGITHCRRVTNPATAESRMTGCIHGSWQRIAPFNSAELDGRDSYTRGFKYPHSQRSAGIRSGGHRKLQCLLMILSSPNICIKNSLTGLAV
ncbi:hypothetical protein NPIL_555701 [Nephila pilipes]|uniref:Uncharacterized protein n=1 Tax=Nephila pilipes TaxID=299642 RepID=A0A8X6MD38_NEPPI|nr:hypothetical protein NPIL_555701 [Nephila pilipes]